MRRAADTCGESVPPAVPDTRSGVPAGPGDAPGPVRTASSSARLPGPGSFSPHRKPRFGRAPQTGPHETRENAMTSTTTLRRIARLSIGASSQAACSPGWRHRRSRPPRRPPAFARRGAPPALRPGHLQAGVRLAGGRPGRPRLRHPGDPAADLERQRTCRRAAGPERPLRTQHVQAGLRLAQRVRRRRRLRHPAGSRADPDRQQPGRPAAGPGLSPTGRLKQLPPPRLRSSRSRGGRTPVSGTGPTDPRPHHRPRRRRGPSPRPRPGPGRAAWS